MVARHSVLIGINKHKSIWMSKEAKARAIVKVFSGLQSKTKYPSKYIMLNQVKEKARH